MSMASSLPPNGAASRAHDKANEILTDDAAAKANTTVHTFDPDATPEQKASSAGKGSAQLKSKTEPSQGQVGNRGSSVST